MLTPVGSPGDKTPPQLPPLSPSLPLSLSLSLSLPSSLSSQSLLLYLSGISFSEEWVRILSNQYQI